MENKNSVTDLRCSYQLYRPTSQQKCRYVYHSLSWFSFPVYRFFFSVQPLNISHVWHGNFLQIFKKHTNLDVKLWLKVSCGKVLRKLSTLLFCSLNTLCTYVFHLCICNYVVRLPSCAYSIPAYPYLSIPHLRFAPL